MIGVVQARNLAIPIFFLPLYHSAVLFQYICALWATSGLCSVFTVSPYHRITVCITVSLKWLGTRLVAGRVAGGDVSIAH
jgi:hypothetical protein